MAARTSSTTAGRGFPFSRLWPGEEALALSRGSRRRIVRAAVVLLVATVVCFAALGWLSTTVDGQLGTVASIALVAVWGLVWVRAFLDSLVAWWSSRLVVTTRRLFATDGIGRRHELSVPFEDIEAVWFQPSRGAAVGLSGHAARRGRGASGPEGFVSPGGSGDVIVDTATYGRLRFDAVADAGRLIAAMPPELFASQPPRRGRWLSALFRR